MNAVNVVTAILRHLCIWSKPRMPAGDVERITATLNQATDEANGLAEELETIADRTEDPFAAFAHRARRSQFRRRIERGRN